MTSDKELQQENERLRRDLQYVLDELHNVLYWDCQPFEMSSPFPVMENMRKAFIHWQDEDGYYSIEARYGE